MGRMGKAFYAIKWKQREIGKIIIAGTPLREVPAYFSFLFRNG